jgi:hypothetical protein
VQRAVLIRMLTERNQRGGIEQRKGEMTPRSQAAHVHRAGEPDGIGTQFEDWESGA